MRSKRRKQHTGDFPHPAGEQVENLPCFYSDSGLYSPHQRWLPNTLPGLPWGYLPQMPDFSLRCRQSRQISSSVRVSLGAVRSSHSNRDTSCFCFVRWGIPPTRSAAALRTARRSNRRPAPASPHTEISASPQRQSSSHSSPVPQSPLLKPLPNASTPTHGNLRPAHSTAALRTAQLFPHPTAAAVENHTPVSSIQ